MSFWWRLSQVCGYFCRPFPIYTTWTLSWAPLSSPYYFIGIKFRDLAIFFCVRESLYPRKCLFSATRESLYSRNLTFEVTREILIENTKKLSKFAWKSENLAEISLDCESLYPKNLWIGPFANVYSSKRFRWQFCNQLIIVTFKMAQQGLKRWFKTSLFIWMKVYSRKS